MMAWLKKYKKAVVAAGGFIATGAVTVAPLVPPDSTLGKWLQVIIAVGTVAGVVAVRNGDKPSPYVPTVRSGPPPIK